MRTIYWYMTKMAWTPGLKTIEDAPEAAPGSFENQVVAFIHIEPKDLEEGSKAETKFVKNAKWTARKWETQAILLHSFSHLAEEKAPPEESKEMLDRIQERLEGAGYEVAQTPWGHFLDIEIHAPGQPLARIYKEF